MRDKKKASALFPEKSTPHNFFKFIFILFIASSYNGFPQKQQKWAPEGFFVPHLEQN